jgi:hypothetical protein
MIARFGKVPLLQLNENDKLGRRLIVLGIFSRCFAKLYLLPPVAAGLEDWGAVAASSLPSQLRISSTSF